MSRLPSRLLTIGKATYNLIRIRPRIKPTEINRILIAHHLLLGDTIMLTPLLAKLRHQYPNAKIDMTMQEKVAPLYSGQPYGVKALPFNPADTQSLRLLFKQPKYDLAFIPADNRYSWLAAAIGSHWITAFDGDRPAYKSWPVNELHPYPGSLTPWPDINTLMANGDYPEPFTPKDWPAPKSKLLPKLPKNYVVLHIGASTPLKLWPSERWLKVAKYIQLKGFNIIWSCGPGEEKYLDFIKNKPNTTIIAGNLDLAQIWFFLKNAKALICPDTGIAHIARTTGTPTVCLFGPGSAEIFGTSQFWQSKYFIALTKPIKCRNQHFIFKREPKWVMSCSRSTSECSDPKCMDLIKHEDVIECFKQITRQ